MIIEIYPEGHDIQVAGHKYLLIKGLYARSYQISGLFNRDACKKLRNGLSPSFVLGQAVGSVGDGQDVSEVSFAVSEDVDNTFQDLPHIPYQSDVLSPALLLLLGLESF